MSTPNPTAAKPSAELVAASPYLKQAITDLKQMITTIATGDPLLTGARVAPAVGIFINQVVLLEPGFLGGEEGAIATDLNSRLDALAAKLP